MTHVTGTDFWIPERIDEHRSRLLATTAGCVGPPDHQMFMGGVTTAAAITALQDAVDRPVAWASAQFLGRIREHDQIDFEIETHPGRTVTQTTATLRVNGRITSIVRAALGQGDRSDEPIQFAPIPEVPRPNDCQHKPGGPWATEVNLLGHVERRLADADPELGFERLWIRLSGDQAITPALLAVFAEFMPGAHPATRGGSGLDLTLRHVAQTPTTWVLVDTQLAALTAGLYHTAAHLYADDGTLLAIASQTGRLPKVAQSAS